MTPLDSSALTGEVTREEVDTFWGKVGTRAGYKSWTRGGTIGMTVFAGIVSTGLIIAGIVIVSWVIRTGFNPFLAGFRAVPFNFYTMVGLFVAGGAILLTWSGLSDLRRPETWYRYDSFARKNGMVFRPRAQNRRHVGSMFRPGKVTLVDRFAPTRGGAFEYGNVQGGEYDGGYLAIPLERNLPRIILLPTSFGVWGPGGVLHPDQRLGLEGDFDTRFTLYCPADYERDALYLLTPDLMALLIDEAGDYAVELVEDWMYVYTRSPMDFRKPEVHDRMQRIIATVGPKAERRSATYRDERGGTFADNTVGRRGRILQPGRVPLVAYSLVAAMVVWTFSPLFSFLWA